MIFGDVLIVELERIHGEHVKVDALYDELLLSIAPCKAPPV